MTSEREVSCVTVHGARLGQYVQMSDEFFPRKIVRLDSHTRFVARSLTLPHALVWAFFVWPALRLRAACRWLLRKVLP
jgi:hypothetical protein